MKCYKCGKKDILSAIRVYMPPKDARCKAGFKDICSECYPEVMAQKGYARGPTGIWAQYEEGKNG